MEKITCQVLRRCEIAMYTKKEYANPFLDVEIDAVFTHEDGTVITLPGFWNGDGQWKVCFSPTKEGLWKYKVTANDGNNDLTVEGEILATENLKETILEQKGFIRLEPGKRSFVYGDGTPFFYFADTHWQAPNYEKIHQCNYPGCNCGNMFTHIVNKRLEQGFNVYQTYFAAQSMHCDEEKEIYPMWLDSHFDCINPRAFDKVDWMFSYLADHGMTIALGNGCHASTPNEIGRLEPLMAFGRYLVARYACMPLVWIAGQEINMQSDKYDTFGWYCQVSNYMHNLDGYNRPFGAHLMAWEADHPSIAVLNNAPWHQWWTIQIGHANYVEMRSRYLYKGYYDLEPKKVCIESECSYEDIYCGGFVGHDFTRIHAWRAALSGCHGITYGVTGIWLLSYSVSNLNTYSPEPWYIGLEKPGADEISYLKKFMEYVGFDTLEPSFKHDMVISEERKKLNISCRDKHTVVLQWCGADDEIGDIIGLEKGNTYTAKWFDPMTGKFLDNIPSFIFGGDWEIPRRPTKRDWILLITDEELGTYETEPMPPVLTCIAAETAKLGELHMPIAVDVMSFKEGHEPQYLVDGNEDTYWEAFTDQTSVTFKFDLGVAKKLDYLSLTAKEGELKMIEYIVYGSNDGVNYDIVLDRKYRKIGIGGQYPVVREELSSGKYRYVKLFMNAHENTAIKLSEMAFYSKAAH